ncbi:DEAD/DEAH box helicase family protein [Candidatus Binatus sp.]|uniref:type I restriction endonuclease subunit R n=1 Tax=Candidatus Binatus sp. TaxID=2811406 RepID=UPI003BAEE70A
MDVNEATTRSLLIDPQLRAADWKLNDRTQVRLEVPVDGYDAEPWNGVTDYCLYDASGNVLAVVEAKRCSRNARDADEQLRYYVNEIAKKQPYAPFGFMANGHDIWFWEVGLANPRLVAGFFTPTDLERLNFLRQNRRPLETTAINSSIVERPYQHEAIRRLADAFTVNKRRALLVMATGTGKTRVAMALIDVFLRANQARNILFLADRDALVDQTLTDGFKAHLPHEPRDRIYTHQIDKTKRLFVSNEQTMSLCYTKFSSGFFDLIIFDEAHRSLFKRFTEVIEYFDARMIGLTATPANFIDRDTFRLFGCDANAPTFLYDYPQAVKEGFLVDFSLYQAHTSFQRKGIKGVDLSEEDRNALIEQGIDPDILDYAGTEIEVEVSNRDTLRKQWEEVMETCLKDQSGQLPGKTIVFAMTKKHAHRIAEVFEEMYPQHVGVVQVITSTTERVRDGSYGDGLITKFKKNNLPRIAISVDMLDTGIDVPEVVNLVFMKPVQSRIKLWQMIGRGTRNQQACKYLDRLPAGKKTEFKVIDFWQNDFNKKGDDTPATDMPVLVSVFNTRLKILECHLPDQTAEAFRQAIHDLRAMVARVPRDSFPVKKVWLQVAPAWEDDFWTLITPVKLDFLRLQVAPLLRFAADVDVAAETFTHKVERLKLQILRATPSPQLLQSIAEDVSLLPDIAERVRSSTSAALAISPDLATATPAQLTQIIRDLAPQMRNRRDRPSAFLKIDLPDFIATHGYISVGEDGHQILIEEYKRRVDARVFEIVEKHPALSALREGREVTDDQLIDLERTLHRELSRDDIQLSSRNIRIAYGLRVDNFLAFLRHLLALDTLPDYPQLVRRGFERHIQAHNYNAEQIRFLRSVQEVFLAKHKLDEADLYDPPLTNFGRNAVERFFTPQEIGDLLHLTQSLAA